MPNILPPWLAVKRRFPYKLKNYHCLLPCGAYFILPRIPIVDLGRESLCPLRESVSSSKERSAFITTPRRSLRAFQPTAGSRIAVARTVTKVTAVVLVGNAACDAIGRDTSFAGGSVCRL